MFGERSDDSPEVIERFADFIGRASLAKLTQIQKFYTQVFQQIKAKSSVVGYAYNKSMSKLLLALLNYIEGDIKALDIYPLMRKLIFQIIQIFHPSYLRLLVDSLEHTSKSVCPQNIVFHKYVEWQQYKKTYPDANSFHKDEKDGYYKHISQLVSDSLGKQWSNLVNHYESESLKIINPKYGKIQQIEEAIQSRVKKNVQCLGCTQFFYKNQNIKINLTKTTDVIVFESATTIKAMKQRLKQNICSLANGNGGVILFACEEESLKFVARGEVISEMVKESILQQIVQIFQFIFPKLIFQKNAHLSFVPIAKDIYDYKLSQFQECPFPLEEQQIEYIPGAYVTRLIIWNNDLDRLVFYEKYGQFHASSRVKNKNSGKMETIVFRGKDIQREFKKRFRRFHQSNHQSNDGQAQINLQDKAKVHHFSLHRCVEPFPGVKTEQPSKNGNRGSEYSRQREYNYTSLVILSKVSIPKLIGYLTRQRISKFQFAGSEQLTNDTIRLLFHETSPFKLQQIFKNYNHLKGKPLLLIIDNGVKIPQRLTHQQFLQIKYYLGILIATEMLRYYECNDRNNSTSFIEAQSKVSVYYVFLKLRLMNIYGCKLVKFEKNPKTFQLDFQHTRSKLTIRNINIFEIESLKLK